jgi:hypothetical protein
LLLDLWRHPLLESKYGDLIEDIRVLNQPTQVVVTQRTGPALALKSIIVVSLGISRGMPTPKLVEWRACLSVDGTATFLQVDVARQAASLTSRELTRLDMPTHIEWEGPLPSPGSTTQLERVIFRGFLAPACGMTLELLSMRVQKGLTSKDAIVGTSTMMSSKTALLADITSTEVLRHLNEHLQAGILITPKMLLMEPRHDLQFWSQHVDKLARMDAACCVTGISWRRSNGGRPWVRPQLLAQDLRNKTLLAKNRAAGKPGLDPDTALTLLVNLSGHTLGGAPEALKTATVSKLAELLGKPLQQAPENRALKEYEWMPVNQAGSTTWTGQVRLRVSEQDEATTLHSKLHGTPVWTGVSWCHLSIGNPLLPVWASPAPPGGGAGRATGRPTRR